MVVFSINILLFYLSLKTPNKIHPYKANMFIKLVLFIIKLNAEF